MRRPTAPVLALSLMAAATLPIVPMAALPRETATAAAGATHAFTLVVAVVAFARARVDSQPVRRACRLFAAGLGAVALGLAIQVAYVVVQGAVPVPSLGDAIAVSWVPLVVSGLWGLPSRDDWVRSRSRLLADWSLASSALLMISWELVIRPLWEFDAVGLLGRSVHVTYPIVDVVVAAMAFAVVPRVRAEMRPFLNYAGLGLLLVAVSDSGIALQVGRHGGQSFGWPDLAVQAGLSLLITGALVLSGSWRGVSPRVWKRDDVIVYVPVGAAVVILPTYVARGNDLGLGGTLAGAVVTVALVSRQVLLDREVRRHAARERHAASHDDLTGLSNRNAFVSRLVAHLAGPDPAPAAVFFADLNGFKEVNDMLGHDQGDRVLRDFADQLRAVVGDDRAARLGGDEFAGLVVADDPGLVAEMLAARLVRVEPTGDRRLAVTSSVGIAVTMPGDTAVDVLRRADHAMYTAKRSSQQPIATYDESMAVVFDRRKTLLAQLPGAIRRGEMSLVYQPMTSLRTGEVAGAEALLRWTHPVLGPIPPAEFVPLAEDSGEILTIGPWVLETAVEQVAAWEAQGRFLPQIFVNMAATQFDDALPAQVMDALARHGVSPRRLVLEVTESQVLAASVSQQARALRAAGVRIALDDFGSGFSSLAQLATLPVDVLKIDRGFILSLKEGSGRRILDTVVTLARSLNLLTVVEGIESHDQDAVVRSAGVDVVQGYLYSRPVPPDQLLAGLPPVAAGLLPRARTQHPA